MTNLELDFPEMEEYFLENSLFGKGVLTLLLRYSHPNEFIKANRNKIVRCMAKACPRHKKNYEKYADDLISLAKNCLYSSF